MTTHSDSPSSLSAAYAKKKLSKVVAEESFSPSLFSPNEGTSFSLVEAAKRQMVEELDPVDIIADADISGFLDEGPDASGANDVDIVMLADESTTAFFERETAGEKEEREFLEKVAELKEAPPETVSLRDYIKVFNPQRKEEKLEPRKRTFFFLTPLLSGALSIPFSISMNWGDRSTFRKRSLKAIVLSLIMCLLNWALVAAFVVQFTNLPDMAPVIWGNLTAMSFFKVSGTAYAVAFVGLCLGFWNIGWYFVTKSVCLKGLREDEAAKAKKCGLFFLLVIPFALVTWQVVANVNDIMASMTPPDGNTANKVPGAPGSSHTPQAK